jgi:hypothetical protein
VLSAIHIGSTRGRGRDARGRKGGPTLRLEKTWGVAFLSATGLIRSLPLTQLRSLGYRGRRCGYNTKHQSTKVMTNSEPPNQGQPPLEGGPFTTHSHGPPGLFPPSQGQPPLGGCPVTTTNPQGHSIEDGLFPPNQGRPPREGTSLAPPKDPLTEEGTPTVYM